MAQPGCSALWTGPVAQPFSWQVEDGLPNERLASWHLANSDAPDTFRRCQIWGCLCLRILHLLQIHGLHCTCRRASDNRLRLGSRTRAAENGCFGLGSRSRASEDGSRALQGRPSLVLLGREGHRTSNGRLLALGGLGNQGLSMDVRTQLNDRWTAVGTAVREKRWAHRCSCEAVETAESRAEAERWEDR